MSLNTRRSFAAVLFATAALALVPAASATDSPGVRHSAATAAEDSPKQGTIANGVYAVLREGPTRKEIEQEKAPHFELLYDYKYSEPDQKQAPKYVALDSSSFVPLMLAGAPEIGGEYRGGPMLNLALAQENVKLLARFTRAHLGGAVAIVIDHEIITMHKIRSVIEDGRVQISWCTSNACEILRLKLMK